LASDQLKGIDIIFVPATNPMQNTLKYRCRAGLHLPFMGLGVNLVMPLNGPGGFFFLVLN
jgi:hypothetical protein